MKQKEVYYAHFMGIYNTPQELRDIETLEALGLKVINPNDPEIIFLYEEAKKRIDTEANQKNYETAFEVFYNLVRSADVFAFRGLPDGKITGGVAMELKIAQEAKKIIIELPCSLSSRPMNGIETREFMRDMGLR